MRAASLTIPRRAALAACLAALACKGAAVDPPDQAPSPQATAEPAVLASPPVAAGGTTSAISNPDAGPLPERLREDQPLAPDSPHEAPREPSAKEAAKEAARDLKELSGYGIQAVLRSGDAPSAPRAPEVNSNAIDLARRRTEARLGIEISQTRARFVLTGGFVLPQGTELRSRVDRYGHVVLWPGDVEYGVVAPGALRALLGERRLDVAPLSPADVAWRGEGPRRLSLRTRRVDVTTRAASATLEIAALKDAADGGTLVCRMLLDLMNAPPSTAVCGPDEVPLHAEIRWTTRGSLTFEATSIARRADLLPQDLAAPPAAAAYRATPPSAAAELVVSKGELAAFRTAPVDVPQASARDAQALSPDAGLALINASDELRMAWLDGVPVAWVGPGERFSLTSLVRGRYVVQWRTFLGDAWEPPATLAVPGSSEVGSSRGSGP